MAELVTIARPYAEAAFRLAKEQGALESWSQRLNQSSTLVKNEDVAACLANPKLSAEQKAELILSLQKNQSDAVTHNFIHILAENNRLVALPEIAEFFEILKSAEEGVKKGVIRTAFALDDKQRAELQPALEKYFKSRLRLSTVVDADLIGGITVEVGDQVLDGSVRGRLLTLSSALSAA